MSDTSALDAIITRAIEDAKERAVRETLDGVVSQLGDDHEIKSWLRGELLRLLREDNEIKERLRAAVLKALDAPARRW